MKLDEVVRYLVQFLLGENNEQWVDCVSYGGSGENCVNIVPSGFFREGFYLQPESLPTLPLKLVNGIPLLYGEDSTQLSSGKVTTRADIIAGTFFLITRYEEYIRPEVRDCHGRFPGKQSLPYRAGFLHRPIVEEYGVLLRRWLREAGLPVTEPEKGIRMVYLTHDVDCPWRYTYRLQRLLSMGKDCIVRRDFVSAGKKLLRFWGKDPFLEAFDWLKEQDGTVLQKLGKEQCQVIYFLLCAKGRAPDDCAYSQKTEKTKKLLAHLKDGAQLGLHTCYYSGMHPENLDEDVGIFRTLTGQLPVQNRYHFLTCREPGDLRALYSAGITDDYTFAYAEVAGFRLGTCRAVRWIDAEAMEITGLTLHPMTIMECTLEREGYMNLNEDEAVAQSIALLDQVYEHSGEVTLLWHNTSVARTEKNYQRQLYCKVLDSLPDKMVFCKPEKR